MRPFSDPEARHPNRATTNGASRPRPIVPAAELQPPPDRLADLVTCMVDLLEEVCRQPTGSAPHATGADPRLRAAITRLQRLEGSLEERTAGPACVHQLPPRIPSPSSGDRGEWVAAGTGSHGS
jgi:hypothetical protein